MQGEVGRRDSLAEPVRQVDADHFRRQKINRLPEHPGLRLDPADPPANDAEPVDHRGVRVGADKRVGIVDPSGFRFLAEHPFGEVFEVDLVDDADPRRDHSESLERLLAPLQKLVALAVALELHFQIQPERVRRAVEIDLHRMVNHEVHRHERLDDRGVAAERFYRAAHRGKIDEERDSREILQDDPRHHKRDFLLRGGLGIPVRQRLDIFGLNLFPVAVSEDRLEDDPDADREFRDRADAQFFECGKRMQEAGAAVAGVK